MINLFNLFNTIGSWVVRFPVLAILGIDTWFENVMRDWVKGNLQSIMSEGGLLGIDAIAEQVKFTPLQYRAVFNLMQDVTRQVLIPIGIIILSSLLFYTLVNEILEKNKTEDSITVEFLIKLFLKAVIGLFLINNSWNITSAILDFSALAIDKVARVIGASNAGLGAEDLARFEAVIDATSGGQLFMPAIISSLTRLILWAATGILWFLVYSRVIEIYLLMTLGSISISTFINKEWSQIGTNYIKKIVAKGLQGVIFVLVFGIMNGLQQNVMASIADSGGVEGLNTAMLKLLIFAIITLITLNKTGSIANSVVGAN